MIDPRCRFHAVKKINPAFARKARLGPVTRPQAEARIAMDALMVEAKRKAAIARAAQPEKARVG